MLFYVFIVLLLLLSLLTPPKSLSTLSALRDGSWRDGCYWRKDAWTDEQIDRHTVKMDEEEEPVMVCGAPRWRGELPTPRHKVFLGDVWCGLNKMADWDKPSVWPLTPLPAHLGEGVWDLQILRRIMGEMLSWGTRFEFLMHCEWIGSICIGSVVYSVLCRISLGQSRNREGGLGFLDSASLAIY